MKNIFIFHILKIFNVKNMIGQGSNKDFMIFLKFIVKNINKIIIYNHLSCFIISY
jgi:hypothetical protein